MVQVETPTIMVSYYKMLSIGALNVINKCQANWPFSGQFLVFLFNLLQIFNFKAYKYYTSLESLWSHLSHPKQLHKVEGINKELEFCWHCGKSTCAIPETLSLYEYVLCVEHCAVIPIETVLGVIFLVSPNILPSGPMRGQNGQ